MRRPTTLFFLIAFGTALCTQMASAQFTDYLRYGTAPLAYPFILTDSALFGRSAVSIGDLDQNGVSDLAVGELHVTDTSTTDRVRILFMDANRAVDSSHVIDATDTIAGNIFAEGHHTGTSLAAPGDLNNDGIPDLVVGSPRSDIAGSDAGAIHILLLRRNGSVMSKTTIHRTTLNFSDAPPVGARFGTSVCAVRDLDFDGRPELLVGAPFEAAGGTERGACYLLTLDDTLNISGVLRIARGTGGLAAVSATNGDHFGTAVADAGDADRNGYADLAISAVHEGTGTLHLVLMKQGGLHAHSVINPTNGYHATGFGGAIAALGARGDTTDLAISSHSSLDGAGQVWYTRLGPTQEVKEQILFTDTTTIPAHYLPFDDADLFGFALAAAADLDGNGSPDLWVGSPAAYCDTSRTGTIWSLNTPALPTKEHVVTTVQTLTSAGGGDGLIEASPRNLSGAPPVLSWSANTDTGPICDSLEQGAITLTLERASLPDLLKHYTMGFEVNWKVDGPDPVQVADLKHLKTHAQELLARATNRFPTDSEPWGEYIVPEKGEGARCFGFAAEAELTSIVQIKQGFYFREDGSVFSISNGHFKYQGIGAPGNVYKLHRSAGSWTWYLDGDSLPVSFGEVSTASVHLFGFVQGNASTLRGVHVSHPPALHAVLHITHATRTAPRSGSITAQVIWGEEPIDYLMPNEENSPAQTDMPAGIYSVQVTDAAREPLILEAIILELDERFETEGPQYDNNHFFKLAADGWDEADDLRGHVILAGDTGWVQVSLPDETAEVSIALHAPDTSLIFGLRVDNRTLLAVLDTAQSAEATYLLDLDDDDVIGIRRIRGAEGDVVEFLHNGTVLMSNADDVSRDLWLEVTGTNGSAKGAGLVGGFSSLSGFSECDTENNYTTVWTYNEDGTVRSTVRTFMDHLGRPTQTHTSIQSARNVLVSETLYDGLGRAAIQTLAAPIFRSTVGCYREGFIRASSGENFGMNHFDQPVNSTAPGEVYNPMAVQQTERGTLGWWYSNNNNRDAHVPASVVPYSRIIYQHDAFGRALAAHQPGEQLKAGSGHGTRQFTMNGADILRHFSPPDQWGSLNVSKTIVVDAEGNENITYTNDRGQVLATCRSGLASQCPAQRIRAAIVTDGERRLDIHVPASQKLVHNNDVSSIRLPIMLMSGYNMADQVTYQITDIESGLVLTEGVHFEFETVTIGANPPENRYIRFLGPLRYGPSYLRISYELYLDMQQTECCLPASTNNTCCPISGALMYLPDQQVWYTLDYGHWSINQYSAKGELTTVIPPEGVDCDVVYNYASPVIDDDLDVLGLCQFTNDTPAEHLPQTVDNVIGTVLYSVSDALYNGGSINPAAGMTRSFAFYPLLQGSTPVQVEEDPYPGAVYSDRNDDADSCDYVYHAPAPPLPTGTFALLQELHYVGSQQQEAQIVRDAGGLMPPHTGTAKWSPTPVTGPGGPSPVPDPCEGLPAQTVAAFDVTLGFYSVVGATETLKVSKTWQAYLHKTCLCELVWTFGHNLLTSPSAGVADAGYDDVVVKLDDVKVNHPYLWAGDLVDYLPTSFYHDMARFLYFTMPVVAWTGQVNDPPEHRMKQTFKYDPLSQLQESDDPDRGMTRMLYNTRGQLRFSQDAAQAQTVGGKKRFSFVDYDRGGRTLRSGVYAYVPGDGDYYQWHHPLMTSSQPAGVDTYDEDLLEGTAVWNLAHVEELSTIAYDEPASDFPVAEFPTLAQRVLPGLVSRSGNAESITWYSYDVRGRTEWTVHYTAGLEKYHTVHYEYDGKGHLKRQTYQQEESSERFDQWYGYDADGRLKEVSTSTDGVEATRTRQARYRYYLHGPPKRTELGTDAQGIDQVYTIQGWLKGINSPDAAERDPGRDGVPDMPNAAFQPDLFGLALDYFQGDYVRAGSEVQSQLTPPTAGEPYADRYTGLVRAQRWNNRALADAATHRFGGQALMYSYTYDALGQLTAAALGTVTPTALHPGAVVLPVADYALSGISYDLNGNLLSLTRKGQADVSLNMDQLTYHYPVSSGHRIGNSLDRVTDAQTTTAYPPEINLPAGQQAQNYRYSAIGQLRSDYAEGRFYTYYAGNGRVKGVYADASLTVALASFTYDAGGNRLCKTAYASNGTTAIERTWYLRDAGGTVLCYRKQDLVAPSTTEELPIPGVGTYLRSTTNVRYELTDHLGNTRVSFTYASNVITVVEAHDYYPHGGLLPSRQFTSSGASPLAYQGQEYDAEVGLTAFNLRQYDARLGRWLTPDPYGQYHSPYLAMSNNPVLFVDPDGGSDMPASDSEDAWRDYYNRSKAEVDSWKVGEWGQDYSSWYGQGGVDASGMPRGDLVAMDGLIRKYTYYVPYSHVIYSAMGDRAEAFGQARRVNWAALSRDPQVTAMARAREEARSAASTDQILGHVQTGLSVASFIPGLNVIAGIASAGVAAYRGDWGGVAEGLVSAVPFGKVVATGAKAAGAAYKALNAAGDAKALAGALPIVARARGASSQMHALGTARDNLLARAQNPRLRDAINNLYRPGAKAGRGSSMDALRLNGSHVEKVLGRRTQLQRILKEETLNPADREIARRLLIDIQDALGKSIGRP